VALLFVLATSQSTSLTKGRGVYIYGITLILTRLSHAVMRRLDVFKRRKNIRRSQPLFTKPCYSLFPNSPIVKFASELNPVQIKPDNPHLKIPRWGESNLECTFLFGNILSYSKFLDAQHHPLRAACLTSTVRTTKETYTSCEMRAFQDDASKKGAT
jgi:hypothetical protein